MFRSDALSCDTAVHETGLSAARRRPQRVEGKGYISFRRQEDGPRTELKTLFQEGSAKIRLPKTYDSFVQAVLINTAGGLTGGDRIDWRITLGTGCRVAVSSQACEKAYRADDGEARVETRIEVGENAELHWLPQETILYDRSALSRVYEVDLALGARFLAVEAAMLGREAMGENVQFCRFRDRWRIRREGRLIFADDIRLNGAIGAIEKASAGMGGGKAMATLFYAGPEDDDTLLQRVEKLRARKKGAVSCAYSAFAGKIAARFLAPDTYTLRQELIAVLAFLRGCDLPRVWRT